MENKWNEENTHGRKSRKRKVNSHSITILQLQKIDNTFHSLKSLRAKTSRECDIVCESTDLFVHHASVATFNEVIKADC